MFWYSSDWCRPCRELLLNHVLSGILNRIENGVHENTPLAFRSIDALIELIRRKNQSLGSFRFTKEREIAAATVHHADVSIEVEEQPTVPASSPAPGMFDIFQSCLVGFLMTDCSIRG